MSADDPFEAPPREPQMLEVELDGFAGPLDLLLTLAQREKVDLTRLKILPLAEQYLAYVARAKALKIELAADMLVMAAWLAYLKSRLLAPKPAADEEDDADEMAEALAFRLRRLEAMRIAAEALATRPRLNRDVFARGAPEALAISATITWRASLNDLIAAYAGVRQGEIVRHTSMEKRPMFSLVDARAIMERLFGTHRASQWLSLDEVLAAMPSRQDRRAVRASTFGATLELAREGRLAVRQDSAFAPLYLKPVREASDG